MGWARLCFAAGTPAVAKRLHHNVQRNQKAMVFASCLCRYATIAGLLFAVLFYSGSAIAQTPGINLMRFGGNDQESLAGFAIDHEGNYYIAGTTASLDLPVNALQKHPGGAFLYRL